MIVGADASSDKKILTLANHLYGKYQMRRVYYSAFSPIPDSTTILPIQAPPLMREHRLYQADWLLRFYGFSVEEISEDNSDQAGMLDLDIDPKLAWALRHRDLFPINVNCASREMLLRIPGVGAIGASKIIHSRRFKRLRYGDLVKCGISIKKVSPFIEALDYLPESKLLEGENLRLYFTQKTSPQMSLFS